MRIPLRLSFGLLLLALPACASFQRGAPNPVAAGAPAAFVRLGTEAQTSRAFPVRQGLSKAVAWRTLNDYFTGRQTVAVRDQSAGFLMTAWQASLAREGVPDLRYRTRLLVGFVGDDWQQLQLRVEANWKEGDEWQVGYDRELLDRVAAELQVLLGVTEGARR